MALMLLPFVTQQQMETSKALAPVVPVIVRRFSRDSPHAKQPTNQDEHFEKMGGHKPEGRRAARASTVWYSSVLPLAAFIPLPAWPLPTISTSISQTHRKTMCCDTLVGASEAKDPSQGHSRA